MADKKPFNRERWGRLAVHSQDACNPMGLLNSIVECLREYRSSDEWTGTKDDGKCIPVRLMLFQVNYLLGHHGGIATKDNYPGDWGDDFKLMKEWANIKS